MGMGRFSSAEQAAIVEARRQFPQLGQRTLANKMYAEVGCGQIGYSTRFRSWASVYRTIRRHDAKRASIVSTAIAEAREPAFTGV